MQISLFCSVMFDIKSENCLVNSVSEVLEGNKFLEAILVNKLTNIFLLFTPTDSSTQMDS